MRFSLASCLVQLLCLGSLAARAASILRRDAAVCNGHAELCDRSYGNITFVGAHDSYSVGSPSNLAINQDYNVTQQLNDGIRLLQMQAHNQSGVIQLCHTSCLLGNGGTLASYLASVKTWMTANPTDVVTLLIVNSDGFAPTDYAAVFSTAGLDALNYYPPTSSLGKGDWPTLSALINAGTRLVTFMDAGANFQSVPYIIDEFPSVWESAFDVTTTFDCNVNRTKGDPSTQMYLINHFLDQIVLGQPAPDVSHASTTNSATGDSSLGAQVSMCEAQYGTSPNFLLVDFYEYGGGSVFQVAAAANGVTYAPATPIATPLGTGTAAGSGSGGTTFQTSTPDSGALGTAPVRAAPALLAALLCALSIF